MINGKLMNRGMIDHDGLVLQDRAASRAMVTHMFFDMVDAEMRPGNEHEPDWKDPKSFDSIHDRLTRDIEAKVGPNGDGSTLGLNDTEFVEQTRARGLARLIEYEAITPEEAKVSYGRAFMDEGR